MINSYEVTSELLKEKGYHFFSKDDEEIFIKYIQEEFMIMIGATAKSVISENIYNELVSSALNGDQESATRIIEEHVPDYPKIIDNMWTEINELLNKNVNNVERTVKIINQIQ